jgi:hypothetical protein
MRVVATVTQVVVRTRSSAARRAGPRQAHNNFIKIRTRHANLAVASETAWLFPGDFIPAAQDLPTFVFLPEGRHGSRKRVKFPILPQSLACEGPAS